MRKRVFLFLAGCCLVISLYAQRIHYRFTAPNAAHHEAIIFVTAAQVPEGPVVFRMSRSSPGRYATHEFGKNVYDVKATDTSGKPLPLVRLDADVYEVSRHNGNVQLQYTLYANYADGTYASIDATGFHLNMPATFMWVKGMEQSPISVAFQIPNNDWTIATQLIPGKDANSFTAPNLQYFMDAPVKAGALRYRQWQVNSKGRSQTIRIAFDTEASETQLDGFTEKVKQICEEAAAVFGEYPNFETGRYTFLASINPWVQGDGMEHRNSTMISLPMAPSMMEYGLGTFAHEFFHAWNVERIRPQTLEPFQFEKSNMSDGLWVAEGFTQYYGELLLMRSNLSMQGRWMNTMAGFINTKLHRPGGNRHTVIDNSQHAVFADAGSAIDKNNFENTFSSYYVTGAATALALELDLRTRFNKTLDDYMQMLWLRHGQTEKTYTMQDLENSLAATTGNAVYAADFFSKYVYASEPFPYEASLNKMGITMRKRDPGLPWAGPGRMMDDKEGKLVITANTRIGTPMYDAGIDIGDELLNIDGKALKTVEDFDNWLSGKKPGDKGNIVFKHRGQEQRSILTLQENPDILLEADPNAAADAINRRNKWFQSQIGR